MAAGCAAVAGMPQSVRPWAPWHSRRAPYGAALCVQRRALYNCTQRHSRETVPPCFESSVVPSLVFPASSWVRDESVVTVEL